jgi:uncharacterized protein (TIGR02246 family)
MNEDQQAIRKVISDWLDASARGDYAALDPLMHDEIVFLTAGNEPFGKEQFRAAFSAMVEEIDIAAEFKVNEIEIHGDIATAWIFLKITITPKGALQGLERQGNILSVYKRSPSGQWQLWRDANLVMAKPTLPS